MKFEGENKKICKMYYYCHGKSEKEEDVGRGERVRAQAFEVKGLCHPCDLHPRVDGVAVTRW